MNKQINKKKLKINKIKDLLKMKLKETSYKEFLKRKGSKFPPEG